VKLKAELAPVWGELAVLEQSGLVLSPECQIFAALDFGSPCEVTASGVAVLKEGW